MKTTLVDLQAVEIEINHACNRNCSYCPNSVSDRKTKGVMSEELFSHVLGELDAGGFHGRLSFHFYNEPLLHPKLSEFARLSKARLPKSPIHIYTNGTLLTTEKFRTLVSSGVDRFIVTRHEAEQSSNFTFLETMEKLSPEERAHVVYKDYSDINLVNRGGLLKHISTESLPWHPCFIPSHMMTILVDGRVLSCFEDFEENLVFGDLKNDTLVNIWKDQKYSQFREELRKGLRQSHKPCNGCDRREALPPF